MSLLWDYVIHPCQTEKSMTGCMEILHVCAKLQTFDLAFPIHQVANW